MHQFRQVQIFLMTVLALCNYSALRSISPSLLDFNNPVAVLGKRGQNDPVAVWFNPLVLLLLSSEHFLLLDEFCMV